MLYALKEQCAIVAMRLLSKYVQKYTVFVGVFRMDSDAKRGKLMIVGDRFVRCMSDICSRNAECHYFCPDLLLSCMFDKVVFQGGGWTYRGWFVPKSSSRYVVPNDFDQALYIVST